MRVPTNAQQLCSPEDLQGPKIGLGHVHGAGGSSGVREVRGEVGGRVSFGGLRFGNMFGGLGVPLKNEIKGLCAKIRLAIVKLK